MRRAWGRVATIGTGALVLLMGAGIWRSVATAGITPRAVAVAATSTDETPAADRDSATSASPSKGAAAEFEAMMGRLREKAKGATDAASKQALVEEIVGELQDFSGKYAGDPTADQAQMALGQLQIRMQKWAEAIVTFRGVAERSSDPAMKRPAEFMMAQSLALVGQPDAAKAKLAELAALEETGKSAAEKEVGKASKGLLAQLNKEEAVRGGAKLPTFQGKDLTGVVHTPEQYKGKVLLIDFWATWCGPCRVELPAVKAVYEKYKDRGLVVLGVNMDQEKSAAERYVQSEGLAWPHLFDGKGWKNEIARAYGVTAIPRAILVDKDGVVRHATIRGQDLDRAVGELLP